MATYVDPVGYESSRIELAHLYADTSLELEAMAEEIGVASRGIANEGEASEHVPITPEERSLAVAAGATELDLAGIREWVAARAAAIR